MRVVKKRANCQTLYHHPSSLGGRTATCLRDFTRTWSYSHVAFVRDKWDQTVFQSLPDITGRASQGCSDAQSYQLAQKCHLAARACRLSHLALCMFKTCKAHMSV